jgi:hypothetical protein
MTYESFMYLVRELGPLVKFRVIMFVKAPLEPRKVIGLLLYRFAHGLVQTSLLIDSMLKFL